MQKILLTAFEPFLNHKTNPTEALLERVPDFLYDVKVIKQTLPVVYNHAFERLAPLIEEHQPTLILLMGMAKGATHVKLERVALNLCDADAPDNLGTKLSHEPIERNGPDALFTNLPLKKIEARFKDRTLPAMISNHAGAYVCNNLYYKTLHHIKVFHKNIKVGFVHVPPTPKMVFDEKNIPSMREGDMYDVLMNIIDVILNPVDFKETAQKVKGAKKVK